MNIVLSEPDAFSGGGTMFWPEGASVEADSLLCRSFPKQDPFLNMHTLRSICRHTHPKHSLTPLYSELPQN